MDNDEKITINLIKKALNFIKRRGRGFSDLYKNEKTELIRDTIRYLQFNNIDSFYINDIVSIKDGDKKKRYKIIAIDDDDVILKSINKRGVLTNELKIMELKDLIHEDDIINKDLKRIYYPGIRKIFLPPMLVYNKQDKKLYRIYEQEQEYGKNIKIIQMTDDGKKTIGEPKVIKRVTDLVRVKFIKLNTILIKEAKSKKYYIKNCENRNINGEYNLCMKHTKENGGKQNILVSYYLEYLIYPENLTISYKHKFRDYYLTTNNKYFDYELEGGDKKKGKKIVCNCWIIKDKIDSSSDNTHYFNYYPINEISIMVPPESKNYNKGDDKIGIWIGQNGNAFDFEIEEINKNLNKKNNDYNFSKLEILKFIPRDHRRYKTMKKYDTYLKPSKFKITKKKKL